MAAAPGFISCGHMEVEPCAPFPIWRIISPLLPGAAHSVSTIAIGYPFDTLKTRLQLRIHTSMWQCACQTWRQQGVAGFYRGAPMPLLQLIVKRPLEFAIFEWFNARFKGKAYAPVLGGCLAGMTSAVIGCPFSVVKIRLQATGSDVHSNMWQAAQAIFKTRGLFGFYRGLTASVYKELPFATAYLGIYGNLREVLPQSAWTPALAGGTASILTWSFLLPLDTLKTVIQGAVLKDSAAAPGWQQFRAIVRERGVTGLWAGWMPVALRSLPSSAAAMLAYEWARTATGVSR